MINDYEDSLNKKVDDMINHVSSYFHLDDYLRKKMLGSFGIARNQTTKICFRKVEKFFSDNKQCF